MSNPQLILSTAFPSAQSGEAVIDEVTGNYWIFDGVIWQNVGPMLGATINIIPTRSVWDEIQTIGLGVKTDKKITIFPYSLEPVVTDVGITTNTGVVAYEAGSVSPDSKQIALNVYIPEILQGYAVIIDNEIDLQITAIAPSVEAFLGAAAKPQRVAIGIIGAFNVNIQTTAKQIFPNSASIALTASVPSISAVLDVYFNNVTLLISAIQDSNDSGPSSRFFPDRSEEQRTVRVTECTSKYYALLDSVSDVFPGNSIYDTNLPQWTDGRKGVTYSSTRAKFGSKSILFSNKTSWLQASYNPSLAFGTNPFTMEAWVNFYELTTTEQYLFDNLCITSTYVILFRHEFEPATHTLYQWFHSGAIVKDTWIHLAVTRQSDGFLRLYVNGTQVGSAIDASGIDFPSPVYAIGTAYHGRDTYQAASLKAFVQEVRITNNFARYTGNFTPPSEGFEGLGYDLPTDDLQTVPDSSIVLQVNGDIESGTGLPQDFSPNNTTITPIEFIDVVSADADTYWGMTTFLLQPDGPSGTTTAIDKTGNVTSITNSSPTNVKQLTTELKYAPASWYFAGGTSSTQHFLTLGDPLGMRFTPSDVGTIEMWFYLTRTSGFNVLVYKGTYGTNENYYIAIGSNATQIIVGRANGGSSNYVYVNYTTTINQWHHLAVTTAPTDHSSPGIRVYVDGSYRGGNASFTFTNSPSGQVTIGGAIWNNQALNVGFQGYIAEFRVTKGIVRYSGNSYTVPTSKFESREPDPVFDPHLSDVSVLMKMNGANNSNTFVDSSVNNFPCSNESFNKPVISTSIPRFGGASGRFTGQDSYLFFNTTSNPSAVHFPGDFTIECWIYLIAPPGVNSATGDGGLITKWGGQASTDGTTRAWSLCLTSNPIGLRFKYGNNGVSVGSFDRNYNFTKQNWYHIAVSRTSGVVRVFVDGTQQGAAENITANLTSTCDPSDPNGDKLQIGLESAQVWQGLFDSKNSINGYIDDVRITKNVGRYTSNFTPPQGPLYSGGDTPTVEASTLFGADPFGNNTRFLKLKDRGYYSITGNSNLVFNKQPFCVEFWIYPTEHPAGLTSFVGFYVLDGESGTSPRLLVDWDDARNNTYSAVFGSIKGDTFALGSSLAAFGNHLVLYKWQHIAYTRDSLGEARVFVNGRMIGSPQFLYSTDSFYRWTDDGYQDFSTGFTSIGVNPYSLPAKDRAYNGYIYGIRVTKGYARYVDDFEVSRNAILNPFTQETIELKTTALFSVNTFAPYIFTRTGPYIVAQTSASALKSSTVTLPLPSGTTTGDVTHLFFAFNKISRSTTPYPLYGDSGTTLISSGVTSPSTLDWRFSESGYVSSNNYDNPIVYHYWKVWSGTPSAEEASFKMILDGSLSKSYLMGYFAHNSTSTTVTLNPIAAATPSLTLSYLGHAVREADGIIRSGSGTVCIPGGTTENIVRTTPLADGSLDTWLVTVRNTSGSMFFVGYNGIAGTGSCCSTGYCGDKYPDIWGTDTFLNLCKESAFNEYKAWVRVTVKYLRTGWDGTLNTAGPIKTGGNDSTIYFNGLGAIWDGQNAAYKFTQVNPTQLGGNVGSLYQNLNSLRGNVNGSVPVKLTDVTPGAGQIDTKTYWVPICRAYTSIWNWENETGTDHTRFPQNYIPGFWLSYVGGGGGPAARSGIGIAETSLDIAPNLKYEPRFIKSSSDVPGSGLIAHTGQRPSVTTCILTSYETDICYDGNSSTYVTFQGGQTHLFEFISAGKSGSAGSLWNCCNGGGWCRGEQIWDDPRYFGYSGDFQQGRVGWSSADKLRITVRIVRTTWDGVVGNAPSILVGGPPSTIKLVRIGHADPWAISMGSLILTDSLVGVTVPTWTTGSNGEIITYSFDMPMNSTAFSEPFAYSYLNQPPTFTFEVVGGSADGVTSSVGIVESYAEYLPFGYDGASQSAPESVSAHAITVRGTGTYHKNSMKIAVGGSTFYTKASDPAYSPYDTSFSFKQNFNNRIIYMNAANTGVSFAEPRTYTKMPVSLALKEKSLWVNLTVADKGKDICSFNSIENISNDTLVDLKSFDSEGVTGVIDPTIHLTSRISYGYYLKPDIGYAVNQDLTTPSNCLSISLVFDDLTEYPNTAWYIAYFTNKNAIHAKLQNNSAYRSALNTLLTNIHNTWPSTTREMVILPGFNKLSNAVTIQKVAKPFPDPTTGSGTDYDISLGANLVSDYPKLFKNFNVSSSSFTDSYSDLYYNESDYSVVYGLQGNPATRTEINNNAWYNIFNQDYFLPSSNGSIARGPFALLMTRAPTTPTYKGGTKKTCKTEYFGLGEAILSNSTNRFFNVRNLLSKTGPHQVNWFLTPPSVSFTSTLYGEIGWNAAAGGSEPFTSPYQYNLTSYPITDNSWFGMAKTLDPCASFSQYIRLHFGLMTGNYTTYRYRTPVTDAALSYCGPGQGYYAKHGHQIMHTALLKNGRDEYINPAFSSARVGAFTFGFSATADDILNESDWSNIRYYIEDVQYELTK